MEEKRGYIQFSAFSVKDVPVAQIYSVSNEYRDSICSICSERVGEKLTLISYHIDYATYETSSLNVAHLRHFFGKDHYEQENETQVIEERLRCSRQEMERPQEVTGDGGITRPPLEGWPRGTPATILCLLSDGSVRQFPNDDSGTEHTERVPRVCSGVHRATEGERRGWHLLEGSLPKGERQG